MNRVNLLEAFRDFFYYGRKERLQQAYINIVAACKTDSDAEVIDWDQEEFIFNRLFIGPMTPTAPAVASIYLDPEGLIQGPVTAQVRSFYDSIGLGLEEVGREPEDSLAYELDACRHLLLLGVNIPDALELYHNFLHEHIALWVPDFTARAMKHCSESVAVRKVLILLSEWVENEICVTAQQKEMG
ncbi:TorD/DmsD family molecular chaperone [Desulfopila inferna]|uniref:TorD/DmsD family molecular chaperone n=1 Tax=Desulfopila inferna TaxID=468528 RepID=UPI001965C627|nr:molecular chaperone TorD family protein [Desulfopila inferna]MBM9604166.1 molecular chaperone TorD family protein [Desulfopila inferna]